MDLVRYADRAAAIANASLGDVGELREYLSDRGWLAVQATDRDASVMRRFQRQVRGVFTASEAGELTTVIDELNGLLDKHPFTPHIAGDGPGDWHLHVSNRAASVADLLIGEALMGLATLACDFGPERLGECSAPNCENVYVDTSANKSRRYCSDRCSSRANVAAYRARQKALNS